MSRFALVTKLRFVQIAGSENLSMPLQQFRSIGTYPTGVFTSRTPSLVIMALKNIPPSTVHKLTVQGNPVIMMDQGGAYPLYPFYHKSGSNTLHLDGHVNFVAAEKITQFPSSTTPECIEFLDNQ